LVVRVALAEPEQQGLRVEREVPVVPVVPAAVE